MKTQVIRFRDAKESHYEFMDEVLVECPRCKRCAVNRQLDPDERPGWFAPRRLTCTHCGYSKGWHKRSIQRHSTHSPIDDYFELPLWLQETCGGRALWAYNERHLNVIRSYVAADLRERIPDQETGWSNRALTSRLPRWMKEARRRDDILRALDRMAARLPASVSARR
ncbi:MAG: hypothetical protein AAF938_19585 [Myxococcota bacterium]